WQGCGFFIRQVGRGLHQSLLAQRDVLREHAVDLTAEGGGGDIRCGAARQPTLEKYFSHAIADANTVHALANLNDLSGSIGQWYERLASANRVLALHHEDVAAVQ